MSKGNRTKSGVKSASSQMAADLISSGGMLSFDAFAGGCASMVETEDTISLKKLAKRDSSTREKAIRELLDRCTHENADTVQSTFANFAAQFDRIIFDCSPTVRQLAMKLVAKQVNLLKKKAEKDLFNILPWIVFARCDPFTPCATEASTFLSGVFSKEKLDEVLRKLSGTILKVVEGVLSGQSNLLSPSKLMKNDEEDSREERSARLSEQSYGVLSLFLQGEKREEAEQILMRRLKGIKSSELTRGLLSAVSACADPISFMTSCSLFEHLMAVFSSTDQCSLLPLSTDLLLALLGEKTTPLNDKQKRRAVATLLAFVKKCGVCDWDSLGMRLLPLFSSLCSVIGEDSGRATFIANWFGALQANGIPAKECVLYVGDCIKYVLALLPNPSPDETTTAMSMIFFLISESSATDPSTLQALIVWSLPRIAESKVRFFLEEVLRRCRENMPSARPLLLSLLSLHSDHLLFGWEYLAQSGEETLPIHLLKDAPDAHLISLADSISLLNRVIESGDSSLAPLYSRLRALLPLSSLERGTPLPYSPLVSSLLTSVDDEEVKRIVRELKEEDRLKCVEEWARAEKSEPLIRFYRLMEDAEKSDIEKKLLSHASSPEFLANVAASCEFSPDFAREVGIRVVRGYVGQALNETKAVYLSGCARSIVHRLDASFTLQLITMEVVKGSAPLDVSSFHAMATLFFDLIDNSVQLLDESPFFDHIISIVSPLVYPLTHYALLSHYWPCRIDSLPFRPIDSSYLHKLIEGPSKALALFLALYVHRHSDSPSGTLLLPVLLFSSVLRLARSQPLSCMRQTETESRLLEYAGEMIESGCSEVRVEDVLSLLSHCSTDCRPLVVYSLRQLADRQLILPCEADTPLSALPTQGFNRHLELSRGLFCSRNVHRMLEEMAREEEKEEQNENNTLFTMLCDDAHFSLSMSALTGANEYLMRKRSDKEGGEVGERAGVHPLSDGALDFLRCAILTAINSVHSDRPSSAKWMEGRRRLLASAAIQLAILMNGEKTEEWIEFFLPSITPILLVMYGEVDMLDGSSLARSLNLFFFTHPSLIWDDSWKGQWDKKSARYEAEMDQAGIPAGIQTIVLRASSVLENAGEENGEAIVAACRIVGMSASSTISFSSEETEKGVNITVNLPPFMKNLAEKDGWSRCGVLVASLSLLESNEGETVGGEGKAERSVLCDAMAPAISKCLTTIVSKTEQKEDDIKMRFFTEKPSPSPDFLLHWSCFLLRQTLSAFPSIVKMWYTGLPKSASSRVNRFISSSLSPILIDHEITLVMEGNLEEKYKNDQATLTIRRHSNEILLNYILEDTRMRLNIKMPVGWPLLPPSVTVEGSIVGEQDGRKWMLQLNSQLHRNASLVSALSAWLVHAGKKVEGADSCTICMMLVAPTTKQLPKARCRTCHNKFHSSCLYKWFESSNQSSCPLCRTDFAAPP